MLLIDDLLTSRRLDVLYGFDLEKILQTNNFYLFIYLFGNKEFENGYNHCIWPVRIGNINLKGEQARK